MEDKQRIVWAGRTSLVPLFKMPVGMWGKEKEFPNGPFTVLEPQDQDIGEIYVV